MVAGGGEKTTLRFAAQYADASNLGAVSWAGGAFTPDDARHKFALLDEHLATTGRPAEAVLRSGLLAAFVAEDPAAAQAKFAGLPPFIAAFFEQLPVVGTPEDAVARVQTMIDAGFRYVIFIIMPGDEETVRLLAKQVIPHVAVA
jgi:alkanesulfonate monooxygenase SsuD/methylene tetrahydromethanopterin reductase-like flavin-dependent oxidoreductase (luciferase family)